VEKPDAPDFTMASGGWPSRKALATENSAQSQRRICRGPCVLFRQRPTAAYDDLQGKRVPFAWQIFFRHAIPEWRLWSSPIDFADLTLAPWKTFWTTLPGQHRRMHKMASAMLPLRLFGVLLRSHSRGTIAIFPKSVKRHAGNCL